MPMPPAPRAELWTNDPETLRIVADQGLHRILKASAQRIARYDRAVHGREHRVVDLEPFRHGLVALLDDAPNKAAARDLQPPVLLEEVHVVLDASHRLAEGRRQLLDGERLVTEQGMESWARSPRTPKGASATRSHPAGQASPTTWIVPTACFSRMEPARSRTTRRSNSGVEFAPTSTTSPSAAMRPMAPGRPNAMCTASSRPSTRCPNRSRSHDLAPLVHRKANRHELHHDRPRGHGQPRRPSAVGISAALGRRGETPWFAWAS